MRTPPAVKFWSAQEQRTNTDRVKDDWIELAKRILLHIQFRDNLEKRIVVLDYDGNEKRILLKPKSIFEEEGSLS